MQPAHIPTSCLHSNHPHNRHSKRQSHSHTHRHVSRAQSAAYAIVVTGLAARVCGMQHTQPLPTLKSFGSVAFDVSLIPAFVLCRVFVSSLHQQNTIHVIIFVESSVLHFWQFNPCDFPYATIFFVLFCCGPIKAFRGQRCNKIRDTHLSEFYFYLQQPFLWRVSSMNQIIADTKWINKYS